MAESIISVRGIGKRYHLGSAKHDTLRDQIAHSIGQIFGQKSSAQNEKPDSFWALKDVSFDIQGGDVVGIIGRNGAGKSTLLKILSRITEPTDGEIRIKGRMASLLEVGTGFHQELTGRENIFLNGAILGMRKAEIKSKFDEIVAFAEVEKFLDTPVKHYSSGMYVRLAFAVAAHLEPDILLVDEVLAVGDAAFQAKCMAKMDDVAVKQGRTVLFVSHNLAAMQRLCPKGIYIEAGRVKEYGSIAKVLDVYQRSFENPVPDAAHETSRKRSLHFIKWELAGKSSTEKHTCLTGEVCEFILTLVAREDIPDGIIGFVLWNLQGEIMVSGSTQENGMPLQRIPSGTHQVKAKVRLPLKGGLYQVDAMVNTARQGNIERCFLEPKLNVLPLGTTLPEKWQGLLTEAVEFELLPPGVKS